MPALSDRQKLTELVDLFRGNLTKIARRLRLTRQAVAFRLQRHGLAAYAEALRLESSARGQRRKRDAEAEASERAALISAVRSADSFEGAWQSFGLSRRTFYRRLAAHGIDQAAAEKLRAAVK